MILAEQCQADATKACCQRQPGQIAAAMCAGPTEFAQAKGETWREAPQVVHGESGGQVWLRGRAAVSGRMAADEYGGGDGGELAGGAIDGAAAGESGTRDVSSDDVEYGRATQCAPQGAQTGAGTALQTCAVQGMVSAPQGAPLVTIDDATARVDGPPGVTETDDEEGRVLAGAPRGAQRGVGPALKSRAGPGAVDALKRATPVPGGYDVGQEGVGCVEGGGKQRTKHGGGGGGGGWSAADAVKQECCARLITDVRVRSGAGTDDQK